MLSEQSRYKQMAEHGVHVYSLSLTLTDKWLNRSKKRVRHATGGIWKGPEEIDFSVVDKSIKEILEVDPEAYILKQHGIEPAPQRQYRLSWKTFIKAHMDVLADIDLLAIFGMFAALFSWRVMFRYRNRDAWSESDPPVSTSAAAIDRFAELEDIEENDVSSSTTRIKSLQWTRGPPTPFEVFKSTPSHPFAKAA